MPIGETAWLDDRDVRQGARRKLRVETVRSRHIGDVSGSLRRIGRGRL
jgi:hypothetical protein